jgi:hypothetical protein
MLGIKSILVAGFFGGAWGMYLWTRERSHPDGALIAAFVYLTVPYHP